MFDGVSCIRVVFYPVRLMAYEGMESDDSEKRLVRRWE